METTLKKQVPIDMNGQDAVGAGIEIVAKVGMNGKDAAVDAGIENVVKVGTATSHDCLQAYIYVWATDVELIGDWDYEVKLLHPFS
ncbi:unnamed protein product [Sphagnum jensenii]|jgi:hypothetical protein|uniref:Uncharacterized protein n=1 Tax=Sphagnum jensenii TaxID=128206 RepID=A0ABP1BTH1_9BRYO